VELGACHCVYLLLRIFAANLAFLFIWFGAAQVYTLIKHLLICKINKKVAKFIKTYQNASNSKKICIYP